MIQASEFAARKITRATMSSANPARMTGRRPIVGDRAEDQQVDQQGQGVHPEGDGQRSRTELPAGGVLAYSGDGALAATMAMPSATVIVAKFRPVRAGRGAGGRASAVSRALVSLGNTGSVDAAGPTRT